MKNCKEFYITDTDGLRLHAKLEQTGTEKSPLVILLHGFTGHMEEPHILGVRDVFLERGYSVLRAELYGHGKSGGNFRDHTLFKWIDNTLTLIRFAQRLDFVTGLYLCGHSQGGLVAMLAAGILPDKIRALIPLSPAALIPEGTRNGSLLGISFDPLHVPDVITGADWELDGNYIRTAQMLYVKPVASRFHGPVYILHGTADTTVPLSHAKEAQSWYQNCRLITIEGDTHCYDFHLDAVQRALHTIL